MPQGCPGLPRGCQVSQSASVCQPLRHALAGPTSTASGVQSDSEGLLAGVESRAACGPHGAGEEGPSRVVPPPLSELAVVPNEEVPVEDV